MHGLAVTASYLLGGQAFSDDLIHRLIQLLARFGHDELGIPRRIDLRAHLLQAARGEPALHSLKRYYRDHFFHALEVCFLGHVLLELQIPDGSYLWQLVSKLIGRPMDHRAVLRQWYLAALLHDVGYAMDVLNGSWQHISFFKHSLALGNLRDSFQNAMHQLSQEDELCRFGLVMEPGIERDHGIIGALHLRALLENIKKTDPESVSRGL